MFLLFIYLQCGAFANFLYWECLFIYVLFVFIDIDNISIITYPLGSFFFFLIKKKISIACFFLWWTASYLLFFISIKWCINVEGKYFTQKIWLLHMILVLKTLTRLLLLTRAKTNFFLEIIIGSYWIEGWPNYESR